MKNLIVFINNEEFNRLDHFCKESEKPRTINQCPTFIITDLDANVGILLGMNFLHMLWQGNSVLLQKGQNLRCNIDTYCVCWDRSE